MTERDFPFRKLLGVLICRNQRYSTGSDLAKHRRQLSDVDLDLVRVKRELAKIKMKRDILKKRRRTSRGSRCEIRHDKYPGTGPCDVLDLSVSGYYSWRDRPIPKRAQEDARLEVVILAAHKRDLRPETIAAGIATHDGVQLGV